MDGMKILKAAGLAGEISNIHPILTSQTHSTPSAMGLGFPWHGIAVLSLFYVEAT